MRNDRRRRQHLRRIRRGSMSCAPRKVLGGSGVGHLLCRLIRAQSPPNHSDIHSLLTAIIEHLLIDSLTHLLKLGPKLVSGLLYLSFSDRSVARGRICRYVREPRCDTVPLSLSDASSEKWRRTMIKCKEIICI